jgi:hypothetical protein
MGGNRCLVVFGGGNGKRWRRKSHLFAGDVDGQPDVTLSLTMMMKRSYGAHAQLPKVAIARVRVSLRACTSTREITRRLTIRDVSVHPFHSSTDKLSDEMLQRTMIRAVCRLSRASVSINRL